MYLADNAKPLEDLGSTSLGVVAIVPEDDVLELREPVNVEVSIAGSEELLLLLHRAPQLGIAHERDVDDLAVLVEKLVLTEHSEPGFPGDGDRTRRRLDVTVEDAEQSRLSRAVGADEAVPLACIELERDVLEQRARAERLG